MYSLCSKSGRSFRKIKDDLTLSMVLIGQGMISSYPKKNFYNYLTQINHRHSGATILAENGATVMQLQQSGGIVFVAPDIIFFRECDRLFLRFKAHPSLRTSKKAEPFSPILSRLHFVFFLFLLILLLNNLTYLDFYRL